MEAGDRFRTGGIHVGEPVVATQPGWGSSRITATEEARTGEKVGEAGKFYGFPGGGNKGPAGDGENPAFPEVSQLKGDLGLQRRAESKEAAEPEKPSGHGSSGLVLVRIPPQRENRLVEVRVIRPRPGGAKIT